MSSVSQPILSELARQDGRRIDFLIEPFNDRSGCALAQTYGPPLARLVARHEISRWWKIRQCFKAHGGCHRHSAKSAGPDMLNRWRQTDEHHLYLSAKQIGHRRRGAAIRHMRRVNPRHRPKKFASHVVDTPGARRAPRDLAGVRCGVTNELRNGFDGKGWVHRHDKRAAAHAN